MIDTATLKDVSIADLAERLGLDVLQHNKARCYNTASHTNGDRNPSLKLYNDTQTYYCFTCREAGDTIRLVQKALGYDFRQACEWIEQAYGIKAHTDKVLPTLPKAKIYRPKIEYNYPATADKAIYSEVYRLAQSHNAIIEYLKAKGLSDLTITRFDWRQLSDDAIAKIKAKYKPDELKQAGLLTDKGRFIFEINRTLIPYFDMGELVYLRARDITGKGKIRFINPIGKSIPLYNINALYELGSDATTLYIAEGETDTMALTDDGYLAVGIAGGANNPTIYRLIDTLSEGFSTEIKLTLVPDNDPTGDKFSQIISELLYARGFTVDVMQLPDMYKDYGDYKIDKKREAVINE